LYLVLPPNHLNQPEDAAFNEAKNPKHVLPHQPWKPGNFHIALIFKYSLSLTKYFCGNLTPEPLQACSEWT